MIRPEFKDEYVARAILEGGECYTVKPKAKSSLKNKYQSVIFAIELSGKNLSKMKDLSKGKELHLETTKKKGFIKVKNDIIITTAADNFETMEKFLMFYEPTSIPVGDFIDEYSQNISNKNKNKATSRPKRK